jgi:hypothetical protein
VQTFLTSKNFAENAKILDVKRLGKQRVEAIQIANALLGRTKGWKNHPAVQQWKGYEKCLVKKYLKSVIDEWEARGYKGPKCKEHFEILSEIVEPLSDETPWWLEEPFAQKLFTSHKSNLLRKNAEFYSQFFNEDPHLEYWWPSRHVE